MRMDPETELEVTASDEALVERCARGDREAFDQLVDRHGDALFRFASRHCGARRDAEDAVQDGLLAAWRGAATFRGDSSARTWLFQVVLNACRRRHRRRAGQVGPDEPMEAAAEVTAPESGPEERAAARQVGRAIDAALAELSDEAREVV